MAGVSGSLTISRHFHQLSSEVINKESHLYNRCHHRMATSRRIPGRQQQLEGQNHPGGVLVHFCMKNVDDNTDAKLEFMTLTGRNDPDLCK